MGIPTGDAWPRTAEDGTIARTERPTFRDLYPVPVHDMSTEALIHEATMIEGDAFDILDLTEGATFAAIRYRFIRGELYRRGV